MAVLCILGVLQPRAVAEKAFELGNAYDRGEVVKGLDQGVATMQKDEKAELYCRDDESSGCTIEMMDLLKSQEGSAKTPISKPRWSAEIDDAVVKPE